jgi:hypothetical protein
MTRPRSGSTAGSDVSRIEALVVIRLPFQLVPIFKKERAPGEPGVNYAQKACGMQMSPYYCVWMLDGGTQCAH